MGITQRGAEKRRVGLHVVAGGRLGTLASVGECCTHGHFPRLGMQTASPRCKESADSAGPGTLAWVPKPPAPKPCSGWQTHCPQAHVQTELMIFLETCSCSGILSGLEPALLTQLPKILVSIPNFFPLPSGPNLAPQAVLWLLPR